MTEQTWHMLNLSALLYDNGLREALIKRVRHGAKRSEIIRLAKFMGVPKHEVKEDVKGAVVRRL